MKLKSKKVKGMTLIEVIISLLIFSLLAALMVRVGIVTKSLMLNTNHMNNKTSVQAPVAAVQDVDELHAVAAILPAKPEGSYDTGNPVDFEITAGSYKTTIHLLKYTTEGIAEASPKNCDTSMNGHLEFYVIPSTPAPGGGGPGGGGPGGGGPGGGGPGGGGPGGGGPGGGGPI